ncbi:DUF5808 domain-containing protein [Flavobacterium reichenbachii]|uniref:Uncharacterized protein n=1 Tax=Flavobacterium reichenbachii TaxID=362418 RepID=A0A085ZKH4_9FLAO|nr:DUF5808 domain-containing protein [Flavobacterium reichenbachii]KFF04938.1 hypothetical protein IW19_05095 [Flavobacterium reichenbachii]OXB15444.1 hypothetical protein B0A68_10315 [Flavobacterium reichenbachii]
MGIHNNPSEETKNRWHKDPNNWKWGIFYYNPEDYRIFPPKRIKQLGWTINFANPNSLFMIFVLIAVIFILGKLTNP